MINYGKNNLVLGRGRVFFEKFDSRYGFSGEGLRYIGNTDMFNVTTNRSRVEDKVSRGGRVILKGTEVTEETCTGVLTTDNVDLANITDWFAATDAGIITGSGFPTPYQVIATRGNYYQLGMTADNPAGRRGYSVITVTKSGVTIPAAGNYEADFALGMIRILPDAASIADGDTLTLSGTTVALAEQILKPTGRAVRGALRFVSNAMVGVSRDIYIPSVELRADGDQEFKGDKWQELRFTFAATYRPGHELYYVVKRATK